MAREPDFIIGLAAVWVIAEGSADFTPWTVRRCALAAAALLTVLAAVSAPSSLAASLAEEGGLTLVGFLRGSTMNVYAGAQRVSP